MGSGFASSDWTPEKNHHESSPAPEQVIRGVVAEYCIPAEFTRLLHEAAADSD